MSEPKEPPSLEPEGPGAKKVARQFADCLAARERWAHEYGQDVTLDHATARFLSLVAERLLLVEQAAYRDIASVMRRLDALSNRPAIGGGAGGGGFVVASQAVLELPGVRERREALEEIDIVGAVHNLKEKRVPLFREVYELPDAVHVRRLWEGHAEKTGYPEAEKLDASPMAKTMPAIDPVALFKRAFEALKDMRKLDDEDDSYQPAFTEAELLAIGMQLGQFER